MRDWLTNNPETTTEFHFPGQSYTGPGTHIVTRLLNENMPANKTDFVTMLHDIEYLGKTNPLLSDLRAIRNADWTLPGLATKLGLGTRIALDALPGFNIKFNANKGLSYTLMFYLLEHPVYSKLFQEYNINPMQYLATIEV